MTEINDEEHISKVLGQFQLQVLNPLMKPLRRYGQDIYVDTVSQELMHQIWILHWRLEGFDVSPDCPTLTYPP